MPDLEWESPWAEFAEEIRASARKYNDLRNRLGLAARATQQEAWESWCAWEENPTEEEYDDERGE